MTKLKSAIVFIFGIVCIAVLGGCYSFSARTDSHINSVAIPFFENKTTQFGLSEIITSEIARAFVEDGDLKVVDERAADAVLRGSITAYTVKAAVYDQTESVSKMRVNITLDLRYEDLIDNTVIWEQKGITKWGEYRLVADENEEVQSEEDGQNEAIQKIVDEIIARSIETW